MTNIEQNHTNLFQICKELLTISNKILSALDKGKEGNQVIVVPVMSIERFSSSCGISEDTVRGWVRKDCIPNFKVGKRRMINIVELQRQALEERECRG